MMNTWKTSPTGPCRQLVCVRVGRSPPCGRPPAARSAPSVSPSAGRSPPSGF